MSSILTLGDGGGRGSRSMPHRFKLMNGATAILAEKVNAALTPASSSDPHPSGEGLRNRRTKSTSDKFENRVDI
jgi:hypothetical protein